VPQVIAVRPQQVESVEPGFATALHNRAEEYRRGQ
jgi:hypothetical protein